MSGERAEDAADAGVTTGLTGTGIEIRAGGRLIIDGIDCTAASGRLTALVGPNGAGKSTLLRALAAIERPAAGSVAFAGRDLFSLPRRERARLAAFVEQDVSTELSFTVAAVVALGRVPYQSLLGAAGAIDDAVVTASLERTGMTAFAGRDFTTLSGGERQRVLLAKALAQQPEVLLLDEPTNHLDIGAQLSTLALLRAVAADGATVLAALHDLSLAVAYCDAVIVVSDGRVVAAGETTATLTPALLREVYGVEAEIVRHPGTGRPLIAFSPLEP